uniref:ribosomal protein S3 n=1 Tax=Myrothecium inundatum TaxID=110576 RepID=UPI001EDF8D4B|nr:ribosomal protein S3 [Myrothecium inundatum]UIX25776.1 ribosomal protein S3 [Myrothecium inundatum]
MKIFDKNLKKNSKIISLRKNKGDLGYTKYFPAFTKEWKNTIYSFNKNIIKNIPVNNLNIDKIIKSYFNLYFKNNNFIGHTDYLNLRIRRNLLRRIFVSDAEIKHTNNKAVITLYVVNREKTVLTNKFLTINKLISNNLLKRCYLLFTNNISKIYTTLSKYKNEYFFIKEGSAVNKKKFINYKLTYLNTFIKLKHLYFKRVWSIILKKYSLTSLELVRKFHLAYSLNQYKFNKLILLPKLSTILTKILGKKVEYNIINLKSIAYNTDIFTNVLSLKLKNLKSNYIKSILSILNRAHLPIKNNIIRERPYLKDEDFLSKKYKEPKIISHLSQLATTDSKNLDELLNKFDYTNSNFNEKTTSIHNVVYNTIGYKNMGGIRLEVKGRLTKRYRADRSINFVKWKGGLKNVDSSFKRLSSVLFRGNTNSNVSYSLSTGKRRIGAFAVKGWIGGR